MRNSQIVREDILELAVHLRLLLSQYSLIEQMTLDGEQN